MVEIKPIESLQVEEAKQLLAEVCLSTFQWPITREELLSLWNQRGDLSDVDEVRTQYFDDGGLFLVLVDGDQVIGTGAIRRLSAQICELKRMYVLADYQGRGLGRELAEALLEFARHAGYGRVRLDVYEEQSQARALRLYERLGFYRIERYNDGGCSVFMEKRLDAIGS